MVNWNYCERLLKSSSDPDNEEIRDRLIYIDTNWNEFTELEYYEIVKDLVENQQDPIISGHSYGQKDIVKHLRKLRG